MFIFLFLVEHQKVIVQIYNKDKILAYCKISESTEVGGLFDKECEILEYLQKCKIDNVPELIFREMLINIIYFVKVV